MVRVSFPEMVFVLALCLMASTSAFVMAPPTTRAASLAKIPSVALSPTSDLRTSPRCRRVVLLMSEEEQAVEAVEQPPAAAEVDPSIESTSSLKSFFAPNTNVRLGASRDQDGKSNVWAVEPSMKVEGEDVETPKGNGIAITGAIVGVLVIAMAATIFALPSPDTL